MDFDIKMLVIFAIAGAIGGIFKAGLGWAQSANPFNLLFFLKSVISCIIIGSLGGMISNDIYAAISAGILGDEVLKLMPQYKKTLKPE